MRLRQLVDILQFSKDESVELFSLLDRLPPQVEQRMQKYRPGWDFHPERLVKALEHAVETLSSDPEEAELVASLKKALEPVPW